MFKDDLWRLMVVGGFCAMTGQACSALGPCDRSDDGNPPDPYYDGKVVDGYYMSSDWTGPFLPFPGGKRYQFFHGLGCTPREIACWASFNATGIENGSIATPAGNMCVIQEVNSEYIQIKNDTCSEMYIMITASAPMPCEGETDGGNLDGGNLDGEQDQ